MEGDWEGLWREAHAEPAQTARSCRTLELQIRAASQQEHRRVTRAEHFALHGHFKEARNALTGDGLLDTNDPRVREQIKAMYPEAQQASAGPK